MAFKRRFDNTEAYVREEPDTVTDRFNLKDDPFPGSEADMLGCEPDTALPVLKHRAYTMKPALPSNMRTQDLLAQLRMRDNPSDHVEKRYRDRIVSPLTAIRAFCVSCKGSSPKAANMCGKMECPLWAFRLGQNAFYGRK